MVISRGDGRDAGLRTLCHLTASASATAATTAATTAFALAGAVCVGAIELLAARLLYRGV